MKTMACLANEVRTRELPAPFPSPFGMTGWDSNAAGGTPLRPSAPQLEARRYGHDFGQLRVHAETPPEQPARTTAARLLPYTPSPAPLLIQRQPAGPNAGSADEAAQPVQGQAPGNEHIFTSPDGVKVVVFRKCGTDEFGFDNIQTAANSAFEKIFKTECISADRRAVLQKNLKQYGLRIFCKQPNEMNLGPGFCAESPQGEGIIKLSSIAFSQNSNFQSKCAGGNLADVILHELMHATLGASTETFPRSCENSCFGNDRGVGPELCANPKAPNTVD